MTTDLLSLSEAAKCLPHEPSPATIHRWAVRGLPIAGSRIYLNYVKVGRRMFISKSDLEQFVEEATRRDQTRRPAERDQEIAEAEARVGVSQGA